MRPLHSTPAASTPTTPTLQHHPNCQDSNSSTNTWQQRTLWDFLQLRLPILTTQGPPVALTAPPPTLLATPVNPIDTPPSTPTGPVDPHNTTPETTQHPLLQTLLLADRQKHPWGNIWEAHHPNNYFCIISKNTNTINPYNLDMLAITNELNNQGTSIFTAQETNINWNPTTLSLIQMQCRQGSKQVLLSTASSAKKEKNWFQPGGTLLMILNKWMSHIIDCGMDQPLGWWSFAKLIGQDGKRIVHL